MAEVVGTAYVRIRALTTGLSKDIKDGLDSGMSGIDRDVDSQINEKVTQRVKKGMGEAGDEGGKSFTTRLREGMRKGMGDTDKDTSKRFKKLIGNLKKFKLPGRFWLVALAIPALGGALKLAASYITTLVGQLGYVATAAVGLGAALAGGIGALGAGILPIVLAFKAETPAMDAFTESIREQADAWLDVGVAAQVGLLPALDQAFTNLGALRGPMTELAGTMGNIFGSAAEAASELLTSESALESWSTVFGGAVGVFRSLMDGLVPLIGVLPGFFAVTAPLAQQLAESLGTAMENFATFIQTGTESGSLGEQLQIWYDRAESIGRSLWNIIEAMWEIFRVGADVVAPQFETLESKTQGWVDFLRSAEGQSTLDRIFTNALPVAQEFNGLMGDIIDMIITPLLGGDTEGVVSFLQSLRTDWLPLLQDLAEALAENLGPNLQELVSGFIELLTEMAESGALGTFTMLLGDLIGVLVELFEIPGIGEFLGILLTIITVLGLLAGPLGIIIGLAELLAPVLFALSPAIISVEAALAPALIIILAVIAAIAAIIFIWKNWDKIVAGAKKIWENFTKWLGEAWEVVKDFFGGIGDWIAEAWTSFIDFFENLPGEVGGAISDFISGIGDSISEIGTNIGTFFSELGTTILNWITGLPTMLLEAANSFVQWIFDAIPRAISALTDFWANVLGFLIMLPLNIATWMFNAGIAISKWIQDAIPKVVKWLADLWVKIYTWILTTIRNIIVWGVKLLESFIDWIVQAPGKFITWLANIWNAILGWISTTINNIINKGKEILTAFISWIVDAATQVPGKLAEFAEKVWDWITEFVGGLPEKFINAITSFLSFGKELFNSIKDGITGALGSFGDWASQFLGKIRDALIEHAPNWLKGPMRSLFGGGTPTQPTGTTSTVSTAAAAAVTTMSAGVRAGGGNLSGAIAPAVSMGGGGGAGGFGLMAEAFAGPSFMAAAVPTTVEAVNQFTHPLSGMAPISLVVQIGETDITELVDARISNNDRATAQALWVKRR
jgi:phage-related protein